MLLEFNSICRAKVSKKTGTGNYKACINKKNINKISLSCILLFNEIKSLKILQICTKTQMNSNKYNIDWI